MLAFWAQIHKPKSLSFSKCRCGKLYLTVILCHLTVIVSVLMLPKTVNSCPMRNSWSGKPSNNLLWKQSSFLRGERFKRFSYKVLWILFKKMITPGIKAMKTKSCLFFSFPLPPPLLNCYNFLQVGFTIARVLFIIILHSIFMKYCRVQE